MCGLGALVVAMLNLIDCIRNSVIDVIHPIDPLAAPVSQEKFFSTVLAIVRPGDSCATFAVLQDCRGDDRVWQALRSHSQAMLEAWAVEQRVYVYSRMSPCLQAGGLTLPVRVMLLTCLYSMMGQA